MSRSAAIAAVLKASVTSASARKPLPDVTLPSRIAYQRPISSSRALSCATRLRSFRRARKAGCRQAAYARSCAIPHRMILNFIAESMVSSSPACPPLSCDRAIFSAVCSARAISKTCPSRRCAGRARRWRRRSPQQVASLRLDARHFHHLRPLLDVLAQIGVELGGRHHQRHRSLLVPRFFHVGAADRLVDFGIEQIDDRLRRAGRRHDAEPDGRLASAMVGTSGSTVERLAAEVPSARTCPALTFGAMVVMASNAICTWPPITLLRISPDALCGTCTRLVPLIALNSSAAMWYGVPAPEEA